MEFTNNINGVLKLFLKQKHYDRDKLLNFEKKAKEENKTFSDYCYDHAIVDQNDFLVFIERNLGIELLDVDTIEDGSLPVVAGLTEALFNEHNFLPIQLSDTKVSIVTSNPLNDRFFSELRAILGIDKVEVFSGEYAKIKEKLVKYLDQGYGIDEFDEDELDDLDVAMPTVEKETEGNSNDAPIVKFVNKMLFDAISMGASDLHFEPYENEYRIRFRIDGVLREISKTRVELKNHISARLKVISGMDIAEKRKPQDGRIKLKYKRENIDFRVNSLPTLYGEKLVLRILDSKSAQMGIDMLGYEPEQKDMYMEALGKPQGMILVTGPTGSGKTVSLYTGLNILNEPTTNISTAEDPVEINLTGVNQVNINVKSGMTFATALRAFLRQDPDIIMVGEIRDLETAEISIKAAQTGHMVMSTLHTNSAAETITRLRNMGVPSYNVASTLNLIIAQRLVRRLCSNCREPLDINEKALREMGFVDADFEEGFTIYEPNKDGCGSCSGGYKGRAGVYEVVKVTKDISKLILDNVDSLTMNEEFKKLGFIDLRRAALLKAKAGLTSLAEVGRVTIE